MKFTILSHAGLYIEDEGVSVLVDPWLVGSCYWRSWWNFPEPDRELIDRLKPDYIYLTHLHWDHFQGPSLRLFDRETKILVPLVNTPRMVKDLKDLGFKDVVEVPHGTGVKLSANFALYSYQAGISVDSAIVLTNGKTTLLNVNDCKLFGAPLRQITQRFKNIDFVFRSHSSAYPIPYCIEGYEKNFSKLRTADDYIEEFSNFAMHVGASYAIPFASNHCFLHKETIHFNETYVAPDSVSKYYNEKATKLGLDSKCVVMPPGSSWSEHEGFKIEIFDYDNKQEYVSKLTAKYAKSLEKQYAKEDKALASFKAFETYFNDLFASVPAFITNTRKLKVLFQIEERGAYKYWLVDFNQRQIRELEREEPVDFTVKLHATVLNDCTKKKMFSVWPPSKRLKIRLSQQERISDAVFLLYLLEYYETDLFPLAKNLAWRSLSMRLRRWRDVVEFLHVGVNYKLRKKPFKVADLYPVPSLSSVSH